MAILLGAFTAAIFISTAATNILAALVTIVATCYWLRHRPLHLLRHPIGVAVMAFFGWLLAREALGGRTMQDALQSVDQFRPLLFVLFWAPLFVAQRHRTAVVATAAAGLAVFVATAMVGRLALGHLFYPTFVHLYDLSLPPGLHQLVFQIFVRAPDLAGPVLVTAIFAAWELGREHPQQRRWYFAFALAATAVLYLATSRRTSQLTYFVCGFLFLLLHVRTMAPYRRVAVVLLALAGAAALLTLPPVQDGLGRMVRSTQQFMATPAESRGAATSSEGLRLRFWTVAIRVVGESPWIGAAESAYRDRYLAHDNAMGGSAHQQLHGHPHNEYLHIAGSLGLVGLALYLALHAAVLRSARRLHSPVQRRILWYYLLAAGGSAMVNGHVIDMVAGHFHALALLVLGWFAWHPPSQRAGA